MNSDHLLYRLGDASAVAIQMLGGNKHPTRGLTRRVTRYYRDFRATSPEKPESFIVHMVAAWLMTELATPKTQARWHALLKQLKEEPESDLKRVAVSMACIDNGLDERYRSDAIDRIERSIDRELDGVQASASSV